MVLGNVTVAADSDVLPLDVGRGVVNRVIAIATQPFAAATQLSAAATQRIAAATHWLVQS